MGPIAMHGYVVTARMALLVALLVFGPLLGDAAAQMDLAGSWGNRSSEDSLGSELPADQSGIPLTEAGRMRALSHNESQIAMFERQCAGWPASYIVQGPFGLRIWSERDLVQESVVAWVVGPWLDRQEMKIWMDGRPHPSEQDLHTFAGFTTGHWEGNTLVAYTTHMKAATLRTGAPMSDQATMTTRFMRHGDLLSVLVVVEDPVYLAEPWMLSKSYQNSQTPVPGNIRGCTPSFEGIAPGASIQHYLPEQNPFVEETTKTLGIPRDAVIGMPEAMYPEFRKKMPANRPAPR